MFEAMSLETEAIYENIREANMTKAGQFGDVVQTEHIEENVIEQRRLSEVRNEIKDSIVQEYRALSLDDMEEPDDMNDEEASTLIRSIKTWSQDNLDRLIDEVESDGEINDKLFARRQSISDNGRVVNSTKYVDDLWNSNASNSAEEVHDSGEEPGDMNDEERSALIKRVKSWSQVILHKLKDEEDSDGEINDNVWNSNASNSAEEADIFGYTNCDDYLVEAYSPKYGKGILFKMSLHREMIDIPYIDENDVPFVPLRHKLCDEDAQRDSGIEENMKYLDNDLANDATNETEDIGVKTFCELFLDVIISSDTPLAATPNPTDTYSGYYEPIYHTVDGDYLDENQNDNIKIYGNSNSEQENYSSLQIPVPPSTQLWTLKLQLAIQELIDTERTYIESMAFVIEHYLKYFLYQPEKRRDLTGIPVIFGNIKDLCESSKNIFEEFKKCNLSVDCIANVFLQSKQLFQQFSDYLRNKARTKTIVENKYKKYLKQRQAELKDKNTCDFYLQAPVQRLLSYKELLVELQNELKKLGKENKNLEAAISFVDQNNRQIDTLLAIDSINDCPIDLEKLGGMHLLKDKFSIKRKYKSVVFLFEGAVIFTTKNKLQKETYDYKDNINMNVLAFQNRSKSSFIVSNHLECKLPDGDGPFSFELENSSLGVCETWVKEISKILKNQLYQFKHVLKKK